MDNTQISWDCSSMAASHQSQITCSLEIMLTVDQMASKQSVYYSLTRLNIPKTSSCYAAITSRAQSTRFTVSTKSAERDTIWRFGKVPRSLHVKLNANPIAFNDCFNCLPLGAIIEDKILCIHGGLSPDLRNLEQIRRIVRPTEIPDTGLLCDLVWADPEPDTQGWKENDRGVSFTFGAYDKFLLARFSWRSSPSPFYLRWVEQNCYALINPSFSPHLTGMLWKRFWNVTNSTSSFVPTK